MHSFPYPIFVASHNEGSAPNTGHKYSSSDIFELSPEWIGSYSVGFHHDYPARGNLTIGKAIATSGAAIDTPGGEDHEQVLPQLLRKFGLGVGGALWIPESGWNYLADGGFIDNQAVMPLARRSCRKIIALDASADPSAEFAGWERLASMLAAEGMILDASLTSRTEVRANAINRRSAWDLPDHIWTGNIVHKGESSSLTIIKLGLVPTFHSRYPRAVQPFLAEHTSDSYSFGNGCNGRSGFQKRCAFPMQSTVSQSFTAEEFVAYRELGIFLGDEVQCAVFGKSSSRCEIDSP
ncbi:MAG: hypothetical protein IPH76_04340 [Xanthomonadales bacterium]|nr:hypothetical protein [Xanthomonadales bacterium]